MDAATQSWKHNLKLIWFAEFLGAMGMSACLPFLALYVRELGVQDEAEAQTWAGLVYSASFLFSALLTPFWGALGDRVGRKLMLIRAYVGVALVSALMGLVGSVEQLFILRVLQGTVSGFVASSIALVAVTTPAIHAGWAFGFLQTSLSAGNIIGPLIGGLCADLVGMRPAFMLVAGLCLVSAAIIIFFVSENGHDAISSSATKSQSRAWTNITYGFKNPQIVAIISLMLLAMLGLTATQPVLAFYVEQLHAPQRFVGTITGSLVALIGVLGILFAPYWGRLSDRTGALPIIKVAIWVLAATALLQATVTHYVFLFPLRFIQGVFSAGILPLLFAALSQYAPADRRGGIIALGSSATMTAQLISPASGGWIASHWGIEWAFLLSASFFLAMLFVLPALRKSATLQVQDLPR
jgi:DHA1 family multidrug resistance protein-like MFS transporter